MLTTVRNLSFVYVPMLNVKDGKYSIDVDFDGEVKALEVLHNNGGALYATATVSDGRRVEFDVSDVGDDYPLPARLFLDVDEAVKVSYSATATPQAGMASRGMVQLPVSLLVGISAFFGMLM